MHGKNGKRMLRRTGVTVFCMALAFGSTARAQDMPTRTQGAALQVFGLVSYVQPHYDTANNKGGAFGADLNFRPLFLFQPSLEARATFAPGTDVSETTYDFGPRLEMDLGRLRPYGFILIGTGTITFTQPIMTPTGPYTHDSSLVYSGGFGADYMLTSQFGVRGEIMVQSWNLGGQGSVASASFNPRIFSAGVDYRFDFNRVRRNRH
jgi:Outer membrane protein beta-barrel domain